MIVVAWKVVGRRQERTTKAMISITQRGRKRLDKQNSLQAGQRRREETTANKLTRTSRRASRLASLAASFGVGFFLKKFMASLLILWWLLV